MFRMENKGNNQESERQIVHVKCRRGLDAATAGQECMCMQAYRMSEFGSSSPAYKCVKCGHVWTVPLGGAFNM